MLFCTKCGHLVAEAIGGKCLSCVVEEQVSELRELRSQNEHLRDKVRSLESENFRLRAKEE